MNKKDIASFRRQLKVNSERLKIRDIYNVYILKESSEIYHEQSVPFDMLEKEQQELFLDNFKRVLAGQLDERLFELKLKRDVEDSSQLILHRGINCDETESWKRQMLRIVEKMFKDKQYETDLVVTFIWGKYYSPSKSNQASEGEETTDAISTHPFILCSINRTQEPQKELLFDYVEKEFKYNIVVDPIIHLKAPLSGFLFPTFTNQMSDVNHILYTTGKKFELNYHFIEEVLQAEEATTAQDDKIIFEEIVKKVAGDQMNTSTLSKVYEEIHQVVEAGKEEEVDELPTLDYRDVEEVLTNSGVKNINREKVEEAFETIVDDKSYELKASNVLPKYNSKSIKIKTEVADISLSPQDLKYVRQVHFNGKLCLMLQVDETTVIEGFEMIPEAILTKVEDEE